MYMLLEFWFFLHRLSQKYLFFYFVLLNSTIQSGKLNESVILGFLGLNLILKENKSCVFINQLLYGYFAPFLCNKIDWVLYPAPPLPGQTPGWVSPCPWGVYSASSLLHWGLFVSWEVNREKRKRMRDDGKRKEKKRGFKPPIFNYSFFYWNSQQEPLWGREGYPSHRSQHGHHASCSRVVS